MIAEKTRQFIKRESSGAITENAPIAIEARDCLKELDEIERFAEIGKAIEKAFNTTFRMHDETVVVISARPEDGGWIGYEELKNIEELINWGKSN